jgi:myosin-5
MRREAAAVRIQKHVCRYQAQKSYKQLRLLAGVIQAGLRAMDACNEFQLRRQNKAAIL